MKCHIPKILLAIPHGRMNTKIDTSLSKESQFDKKKLKVRIKCFDCFEVSPDT